MGFADRLCYDGGMKVPFCEKVGYALGDGAANLVFQLMMMFQLMFYTDVLGIGAGAAGFDPEAVVQTEAARQAIRLSVSLIPAGLFAIGCAALCFYPISKATEKTMQAELAARRKAQ